MVLGVGNRFRRDDGAGLAAVARLRNRVPREVEILECEGDLVSAVEDWRGVDRLVIVDATSSGSPAGSVRRIEAHARPLPAEFSRASTHQFGVAQAVELARTLGRLPAWVVVYGIEGGEFGPGEGLSPQVEAAVDDVAAQIVLDCPVTSSS